MDTAPSSVPVYRALKSLLLIPAVETNSWNLSTTTELHLWPLQLHNRDINHQRYGNWGKPKNQLHSLDHGKASAPRRGSQRP